MECNYKMMEEYLSLLHPYLSGVSTPREDVSAVGLFLARVLPFDAVVLSRLDQENQIADGWFPESESEGERMTVHLRGSGRELLSLAGEDGVAEGTELDRIMGLGDHMVSIGFTICYDRVPYGFLVVCRSGGGWSREERQFLGTLCGFLGAAFAIRISLENEKRSSFVFNTVMDFMKTSVYITDITNDRILFMNQAMKADFGLESPEGKLCYQVLQRGIKRRCEFCPVEKLVGCKDESSVFQWDEISSVNGRTYRNYDSLIRWMDGSMVHLQQSIDVTELKIANTDELTQLMTRRPGKTALENTLAQAKRDGELVTVCLYDINNLKAVNDQYGHVEGDHLISSVAVGISGSLLEREYAFRLSGDEFVVVFFSGQKEVKARLAEVQARLKGEHSGYEVSFCYGLAEVRPDQEITADQAILLADERMYEQKRKFHILRNEERLQKEGAALPTPESFRYDTKRLYDALEQSTDDYPFVCNMKTGIFRYALAMVDEFDLPGQVIENAAAVWGAHVHEDDKAAFLEANQMITDGRATAHCVEYRAKDRNNRWVWVRCRGTVELDDNGEPVLFAGFITNLGKKNKIDSLTGLYNKLEFEEQVSHHIEHHGDQPFGIMILGIDNLKHINELYNRTFGDEVIRITSQRLLSLVPQNGSIFRLDGDEFAIMLENANQEELKKLYETISCSFENQQEYEGKKYYCTLSGGSVLYPQDVQSYLDAVKFAEYALDYAKHNGKNCCIAYTTGILEKRARSLEMVEHLRASVENDFEGFSLRFQPLVYAYDGQILGAEALARWQCERFGEVSPVEFIPLLEQTGMILPVGKWVLRTAVETCLPWLTIMPAFVLDVNLSYQQIRGMDFVPCLKEILEETRFPARNLVLELTESYFAQGNQHVIDMITEIRELGTRIAMDDFGTGYSTLSFLKEMPVDLVKIDKVFIRDIRTSTFDATFIRFVVSLCHDVGIRVCQEGVETEAEQQLISGMGMDVIQGFLYGRPVVEQEFERLLRASAGY